jgi:hypothetical protein
LARSIATIGRSLKKKNHYFKLNGRPSHICLYHHAIACRNTKKQVPKQKIASETTKIGFIKYIAAAHSTGTNKSRHPEDQHPALLAEYLILLDDFDYCGPIDQLSGLNTIMRKSISFDARDAGFVWVAQRWNNDVGHIHSEQTLAHFCKISNRFCNDSPKDTVHRFLRDVASCFDPSIAVPSSWSPEQAIPPFPYPVIIDGSDQDFVDFQSWVQLRLPHRKGLSGNWCSGHWLAGAIRRNSGHNVGVSRQCSCC